MDPWMGRWFLFLVGIGNGSVLPHRCLGIRSLRDGRSVDGLSGWLLVLVGWLLVLVSIRNRSLLLCGDLGIGSISDHQRTFSLSSWLLGTGRRFLLSGILGSVVNFGRFLVFLIGSRFFGILRIDVTFGKFLFFLRWSNVASSRVIPLSTIGSLLGILVLGNFDITRIDALGSKTGGDDSSHVGFIGKE